MNAGVKLVAAVLAAIPIVGAAQEQAKLNCINDVVYSQEFLARYPNAGAACREVVIKDGMKWVRFVASVKQVKGNQVTADFMNTYEQPISTLTFAASEDARVEVNGKPVKFSALRPGDALSFWVPESRMGFYAEPGASESSKLAVVSEDGVKQR